MVRMVELKGISIKVLMKKVFIVLLAMGVMLSNLINVKFAFAKSCDQYIREYYNCINTKDYSGLYNLFCQSYYEETNCIYENLENRKNHVGIFDIKSAKVKSICRESDTKKFELDTYESRVTSIYKVTVEMKVYTGKDCFVAGDNVCYFLFDSNNKIVGCWNFEEDDSKEASAIATVSYDTPVANVNKNPDTIRVYYNNQIHKVDFNKYVKVVERCEVGYSSWNFEALKACAVAIKNYGIVRVKKHKYAGQGYDVKATEADQVYNTKKENIPICNDAVDAVWNVIWLDSKDRVFPGFHVHSKSYNSYAVKNGGVLSQTGAQKLAKENGYDWVKILRYYYDRKKGVAYYNSEVAVGTTTFINIFK